MIVINTVNDKRFSLNGIEYLKNFLSFVAGDRLLIYNAYDRSDERCSLTLYSDFQVNGITYASAALLQSALLDVIYTRSSLGGSVVANFYQLLDTFVYAGRNGHFVRVNSGATRLESVYSNVFTDAEKAKLTGLLEQLDFNANGIDNFVNIGTTERVKSFFYNSVLQQKAVWSQTGNIVTFTFIPEAGTLNLQFI